LLARDEAAIGTAEDSRLRVTDPNVAERHAISDMRMAATTWPISSRQAARSSMAAAFADTAAQPRRRVAFRRRRLHIDSSIRMRKSGGAGDATCASEPWSRF